MMLLPIIILVIFIFVFLNPSGRGNNISFRGNTNNTLDILNRRFANGEISEEEYLKIKSLLKEK